MLLDNTKRLLQLYVSPRAAMSGIIDEGSVLYGLGVVVLAAAGVAAVSGLGVVSIVVALVVLYAPVTLFLVTLFARVGSFGVALRRDFGPFLACTLMAFAAAFLPVGLAALVLVPLRIGLGAGFSFVAAGAVYFAALMVLAVRTVLGVGVGAALAAVGLSWTSLLLQGALAFLASPFILYFAYQWLRGDISDILGSFGSQQSFRRYLEAATLNPRDAEAHYQLGLIHLHRHQVKEATERFQNAVEIDPTEIDAHFQLGRIARGQERWEDAIAHFESVLIRDPRHSRHETWREAGAVYIATGAFEHAKTVLERFVESRSYDPEGLFDLGLALKGLGRGDEARSLFERCVEAAKTAPDYRRGEVRGWRKRAEQELAAKS